MSTPKKKLAPDEAWDALQQLAADDEVERVLALSDEDLDDELRKTGVNPERVRQRGEDLARRLETERAVRGTTTGRPGLAAPSRRRSVAWVATAALAAAVAGVFAMNAGPVVAWFRPGPAIGPDDAGMGPRPPSPQELAQALRWRARGECDRGDLGECQRDLDEARGLEPAGETRPEVVEMRRVIAGPAEEGGVKPKPPR
jgi:hypothetical protein